MKIKFKDKDEILDANIKIISENVIELSGVDKNLSGFKVFHNEELLGDYSDYKTLYRKLDRGYQLSNDGSVYNEPTIDDVVLKEYTLEDLKKIKIQEMSNVCEQTIYNGVDVDLKSGREHFSLTIQDQLNLMNKKSELKTQETQFRYHADGKPFVYFSKEEMEKIVKEADDFIEQQRIYCNSLYRYIGELKSKESVEKIKYGDDVPVEYMSVVLQEMKNS